MLNPNGPDLSADALWYERASLMGGLACWMTFGEHVYKILLCQTSSDGERDP